MATLRPVRALSIEKIRNLWRNANIALKDANGPPEHISAGRRFDAAYDCAMNCALLLLECNKLELEGQGHHREAMSFLVKTLGLKGKTADAAPAMTQARNATRYDATPLTDEAVVASAIAWADRILAETENWLTQHQPQALK